MKNSTIIVSGLFSFFLAASPVMAAGNAEKGKALFNDVKLGTSGKTCNSCHNEGKGLDKSGEKKEMMVMGKKYTTLEDAINFCIEKPLKGKTLDPKSQEMQDLVAYIKSLKK